MRVSAWIHSLQRYNFFAFNQIALSLAVVIDGRFQWRIRLVLLVAVLAVSLNAHFLSWCLYWVITVLLLPHSFAYRSMETPTPAYLVVCRRRLFSLLFFVKLTTSSRSIVWVAVNCTVNILKATQFGFYICKYFFHTTTTHNSCTHREVKSMSAKCRRLHASCRWLNMRLTICSVLFGRFDYRVPFTFPVELQPPLRRKGQGWSRLSLPARSGLEIWQCDLLSTRWVSSSFVSCFFLMSFLRLRVSIFYISFGFFLMTFTILQFYTCS